MHTHACAWNLEHTLCITCISSSFLSESVTRDVLVSSRSLELEGEGRAGRHRSRVLRRDGTSLQSRWAPPCAHQPAPSHSAAAPGSWLGKTVLFWCHRNSDGGSAPGHLTLAKLLGLHSHHVPMCQVDWACCFWNTYLPGIPSTASVTRCCRSQRSHTGPLFSQAQPRSAPALCGFSHNVFLIYYNHLCEPMSAVRGKKHQHCH